MIKKRPKVFLAAGFLIALVGLIGAWDVRLNAEFKDGFNAVYVENWQGFSAAELARMDQQFVAFVILAFAGFCLLAIATYVLFSRPRSGMGGDEGR